MTTPSRRQAVLPHAFVVLYPSVPSSGSALESLTGTHTRGKLAIANAS